MMLIFLIVYVTEYGEYRKDISMKLEHMKHSFCTVDLRINLFVNILRRHVFKTSEQIEVFLLLSFDYS